MSNDRRPPSSPAPPLAGAGLPLREALDEGQVAAFPTLLEAEMARGRLEAAGIPVRLLDAGTVGVAQILSDAVGGVKVCVATEDLEEARAILQAPAEVLPEDGADAALAAADDDDEHDEDDEALTPAATKDDLALRAFRIAMIAFVVLPGVLHLWSLTLLVEYLRAPGEASPRARRRARAALVVDGAAVAAVAWIASLLLR